MITEASIIELAKDKPQGTFAAAFEAQFPNHVDPVTGAGMIEVGGRVISVFEALEDETLLSLLVVRANAVARVISDIRVFNMDVINAGEGKAKLRPTPSPCLHGVYAFACAQSTWITTLQGEWVAVPRIDSIMVDWKALLKSYEAGEPIQEVWLQANVAGAAAQRMISDLNPAEITQMLMPKPSEFDS